MPSRQKYSSYGPPARVPMAPEKAYSTKLQIHSYSADGRSASCRDTEKTLPRQVSTRHIVAFRDLDNE